MMAMPTSFIQITRSGTTPEHPVRQLPAEGWQYLRMQLNSMQSSVTGVSSHFIRKYPQVVSKFRSCRIYRHWACLAWLEKPDQCHCERVPERDWVHHRLLRRLRLQPRLRRHDGDQPPGRTLCLHERVGSQQLCLLERLLERIPLFVPDKNGLKVVKNYVYFILTVATVLSSKSSSTFVLTSGNTVFTNSNSQKRCAL